MTDADFFEHLHNNISDNGNDRKQPPGVDYLHDKNEDGAEKMRFVDEEAYNDAEMIGQIEDLQHFTADLLLLRPEEWQDDIAQRSHNNNAAVVSENMDLAVDIITLPLETKESKQPSINAKVDWFLELSSSEEESSVVIKNDPPLHIKNDGMLICTTKRFKRSNVIGAMMTKLVTLSCIHQIDVSSLVVATILRTTNVELCGKGSMPDSIVI